jgi:putative DNA primase/helicase
VTDKVGDPGAGSDDGFGIPISEISEITVLEGNLPQVIAQTEKAIAAQIPPLVYQRGGQIVHIGRAHDKLSDGSEVSRPAILAANPVVLREYAGRSANFKAFDARKGDYVWKNPPAWVGPGLSARSETGYPIIRQIIAAPAITADDRLILDPGYDRRSGLYVDGDFASLDGQVPARPSHAQARRSTDLLVDLLGEFSWRAGNEPLMISCAVAAILSAIARPTVPRAPLFGWTAPVAGTGKSEAADLVSAVAVGQRAVVAALGKDPDEIEKALAAHLLVGNPVLCFDNVVGRLGGPLLNMILSQEQVRVRVLGATATVSLPSVTQLMATGNNLQLGEDVARRTILVCLDAGVEKPETRTFARSPVDEVLQDRMKYLGAALTVLRWGIQNGDPAPQGRPWAGFSEWLRRVRDPLMALGFADVALGSDLAREADQSVNDFAVLVESWWSVFKDLPITVAQLIDAAQQRDYSDELVNQDLRAALLSAVGYRDKIETVRLGRYLGAHAGQVANGCVLRKDTLSRGVQRWQLKANSGGGGGDNGSLSL